MSDTPTKPHDHVKLGAVQAAIWKNTDQEGRTRYSVTIERIYRDKDGNWRSTTSFGRDESLVASKVLTLANTRIYELQAEDRQRSAEANGTAAPAAKAKAASR